MIINICGGNSWKKSWRWWHKSEAPVNVSDTKWSGLHPWHPTNTHSSSRAWLIIITSPMGLNGEGDEQITNVPSRFRKHTALALLIVSHLIAIFVQRLAEGKIICVTKTTTKWLKRCPLGSNASATWWFITRVTISLLLSHFSRCTKSTSKKLLNARRERRKRSTLYRLEGD